MLKMKGFKMEAVKEKVVEEPKVDKKPEWDPERQRADQAEANLRKTQARLNENDVRSQQLEKTVSDLKGELEQINAVKGLNLGGIDANEADVSDVVKRQDKLVEGLEAATKEITALKQLASQYEADADKTAQKESQNKVMERIMTPLDDKYGAKYRNEAKKLAEKEVEERGSSPADSLECHQILEKHYIALKEADKKEKLPASGDNGRGGSGFVPGEGLVDGTLKDVVGQIRKTGLKAFLNKT
jgi:chromosome segregation ATPase